MTIRITDLEAAAQLIQLIPAVKPLVDQAAEELKAYVPLLQSIGDYILDDAIKSRVKCYRAYREAGMESTDAMLLSRSTMEQLGLLASSFKQSGK